MANGKIRIRLKAFDHAVIDQTASDIVRTAEKSLRRTVIKRRELNAIERGERTEKEVKRFLRKGLRRGKR